MSPGAAAAAGLDDIWFYVASQSGSLIQGIRRAVEPVARM
jgi:hypothetical protein